jgi:hypothetical protein
MPPDLPMLERAMWPQITAGIVVTSHPHVNERIAKNKTANRDAAQSEERAGGQAEVAGAVVFRLPSRRCIQLKAKSQVREGEDAFTRSPRRPLPGKGAEIKCPME